MIRLVMKTPSQRNSRKSETGIVVRLAENGVEILGSGLERPQAARLMRSARDRVRPIKFFPVSLDRARAAIRRINQSGLFA